MAYLGTKFLTQKEQLDSQPPNYNPGNSEGVINANDGPRGSQTKVPYAFMLVAIVILEQ